MPYWIQSWVPKFATFGNPAISIYKRCRSLSNQIVWIAVPCSQWSFRNRIFLSSSSFWFSRSSCLWFSYSSSMWFSPMFSRSFFSVHFSSLNLCSATQGWWNASRGKETEILAVLGFMVWRWSLRFESRCWRFRLRICSLVRLSPSFSTFSIRNSFKN